MTNDEAIAIFKGFKFLPHEMKAVDMAIKALKQATCEDCISRQAVEEMIKAEMPERGLWEIEGDKEKETVCEVCVDLMQKLSKLPPVTPQPKMGHWVHKLEDWNKWTCSECGWSKRTDVHVRLKYNYCPNCGARMEGENEVSD